MRLCRVDDSLIKPLSAMLQGVEESFRPFGFTPAEVRAAIHEEDEHWLILGANGWVIAYGMLRGWHDGYKAPSLGVAVSRMWRRQGYATAMILFLHYLAGQRGASEVVLHVDADNDSAQSIYKRFGYLPHGDRWICRLES